MSDIAAALRAAIAQASNPAPKSITVEGVGQVYVSVQTPYSASESRRLLDAHKPPPGEPDDLEVGRLLALVLVDERGERLFDIGNAEHVTQLAKLPGPVATAILNGHRAANGATTAEESAALGKP